MWYYSILRLKSKLQQKNSFESITRERHEKQALAQSAKYAANVLLRMESKLFPYTGSRPVAEVSATELLSVLRRVELRGAVICRAGPLNGWRLVQMWEAEREAPRIQMR
jgi:hypothetical protein